MLNRRYRGRRRSQQYNFVTMLELLNFGKLGVDTHFKHRLVYLFCAKVNLKREGKNNIGYEFDEEENELKIK
jgi:hypothetical protein